MDSNLWQWFPFCQIGSTACTVQSGLKTHFTKPKWTWIKRTTFSAPLESTLIVRLFFLACRVIYPLSTHADNEALPGNRRHVTHLCLAECSCFVSVSARRGTERLAELARFSCHRSSPIKIFFLDWQSPTCLVFPLFFFFTSSLPHVISSSRPMETLPPTLGLLGLLRQGCGWDVTSAPAGDRDSLPPSERRLSKTEEAARRREARQGEPTCAMKARVPLRA